MSRYNTEHFRDVMATLASGVAVVTATLEGGKHCGLTVSAFCSVSIEPPLILFCIDKNSNTLFALEMSRSFTLNILREDAAGVALMFASKQEDKFAELVGRSLGVSSGPVLAEHAVAFLSCEMQDKIEAGDHWIVVGGVTDGAVLDEQLEPLVYHRRAFRTLRRPEEEPG